MSEQIAESPPQTQQTSEPSNSESQTPTENQSQQPPCKFVSTKEYLEFKEDYKWLVEGLIPSQGLVNIYAKPKIGKSFAALGLAHAIANPNIKHWNGYKIHKHGVAAYFQVDTPRSLWTDRLRTLEQDGYKLDNILWADRLIAPKNWDIMRPDHAEWLAEQINILKPEITFLDTFREMYNGDENDSTAVKRVVQNIVEACSGSAIVFISHSRKSGQKSYNYYRQQQDNQNDDDDEDITDGQRGSGYLTGRMDSIIKMTDTKILVKTRAGDTKMRYYQDHVGMVQRAVEGDAELDHLIELICRSFPELSEPDTITLIHDISQAMMEKVVYKVRQWFRHHRDGR